MVTVVTKQGIAIFSCSCSKPFEETHVKMKQGYSHAACPSRTRRHASQIVSCGVRGSSFIDHAVVWHDVSENVRL